MRLRNIIAIGLLAGLTFAACSSGGDSTSEPPSNQPNRADLAVVSQLKPVADRLAAAYKAANPGKQVAVTELDPAAVATVVSQKTADVVFAPLGWMGAGATASPLGRNLTMIAVPEANPGNVAGLAAFGSSRLRTTVCGTDTPYGDFTLGVLRRASVSPRSSSLSTSPDCPAQAMKALAAGQLDAALMFRNNVTVPAGVKTMAVPDDQNFVFPIAYLVLQDNADAAGFRTFLASSRGRAVLTENGYLP